MNTNDDVKFGFILGVGVCLAAYLVVMSSAFGADGKKVFNKCKICHSLTTNKMGPSLGNIFNKKIGSVQSYKYSKVMKKSDIIWDEHTLDKFLTKPTKYLKGTKMRFRGLKKEQRKAVIKYLKENQVQ